jgi:hypothetical protein
MMFGNIYNISAVCDMIRAHIIMVIIMTTLSGFFCGIILTVAKSS